MSGNTEAVPATYEQVGSSCPASAQLARIVSYAILSRRAVPFDENSASNT